MNDSHVGGSDFGRASSKLSSPRLVLAVSRAGARDLVFLPQIDTKRVVVITLSAVLPPPSRPRAGHTRTLTTRTSSARITAARAANSARLGSPWLCLVQVRAIWSFCPKSTRREWL